MKLELDRVAIWKATPVDQITCRPLPKGTLYIDGTQLKTLPSKGYRYAKNYGVFSLVIFTLNDNIKEVEKLLDKASRKKKLPNPSDELIYLENTK